VIRSEISGGKAQITGSFTEEQARELTAKINDAISGK
jgi:preprotein translocase subunit SecD